MATVLNSGNYPTSVSIGSVTDVSGMVANVGVAAGIGSQAQSVQFVFPFPVSVAAILIFGSRSTSGNVGRRRAVSGSVDSSLSESGMAENMRVEVEIAAPSVTGKTVFPLPA